MRVTYEPSGVNDFHNRGSINLVVSGEVEYGCNGQSYLVSAAQKRRIEQHFCGVAGCGCAKGAVDDMDSAKTRFGILVSRCSKSN